MTNQASMSERAMKTSDKRLMQRVALATALVAMLAGCVQQAPKQEARPAAGSSASRTVTPEMRADFEAAMARMRAEDYKQGIELMGKVIAQAPNHPVPYINRAIAHTKLGNLKAAEEDLKRALELEPGNPVANNEFGLLYRKTGRFAEARQLYESLLAKYPYYPLVHKNLGILCDLYLRDYECALREYEAYSQAAPEDKNAKIWIADVQRRLGK